MPMYDFECAVCGRTFESFAHVDGRYDIVCPYCGGQANVVILSTPAVHFDIDPYYDKGLGCVVKSRADKRAKMREKGLEEDDGSLYKKAKEILEEHAERNKGHRS